MSSIQLREAWLTKFLELCKPVFADFGFPIPDNTKISCGFTTKGKSKKVLGQCILTTNKNFEIFITPFSNDTIQVAMISAHEFTHAAVGLEHKHGGDFIILSKKLGFSKPWTHTPREVPDKFMEWAEPILLELHEYPHLEFDLQTSNVKKQTTRLKKATCPECQYVVRVAKKWVDEVGAPVCPAHGPMQVEE